MAAEGPTDTRYGVTLDTALHDVESEQRLREFYGAAFDCLGMGI